MPAEISLTPAGKLTRVLQKYASEMHPVVNADLNGSNVTKLDLTENNYLLSLESITDTATFEKVINQILAAHNAEIGVGGYLENRVIYRRSPHFEKTEEPRSIHLGADIWAPAGLTIFAPLAGQVHSFQDNQHFGDYGPTIILQHELAGLPFYTLFGHLNRESLQELYPGKPVAKGEILAKIGPYPENGDWPPHLHFQIIADLEGKTGDFAGVCQPSLLARFAALCPNPNLILQSRHLE